jgi:hypothetical protein
LITPLSLLNTLKRDGCLDLDGPWRAAGGG